MSLYDDWKTYLSDPNSFDDSHFEMLLFEDELYKSPERLFEVLPDAKVLLQRLGRLIDEWKFTGLYFVASGEADQETQVARIDKYRSQLADLGADEGMAEDAALLRQAPILPTYDRSAQSMSMPIDLEPAYLLFRDGAKLLLARDSIHVLLPQM